MTGPGPLVSIFFGAIFWVCVVGIGGWRIYQRTLHQLDFASGVHEFASGFLLIIVAIHCCIWEIRSAQPRYQTQLHRYQHGAHAFAYAVVGCFILDEQPEWLGISSCIFGLIITVFRMAVLCTTKVEQNPTGAPFVQRAPSTASSFQRTSATPLVEVPKEVRRSSSSAGPPRQVAPASVEDPPGNSPFSKDCEDEEPPRGSQISVAGTGSGLMPEVRMWSPDGK
eukprot:CAMPEP_0203872012 /NCGR_PEP_ID=MMETSP0359-20131031/19029_1 /ASSEMBLY_ACC=CAM_ASM_000338 /TAXON_ID=268821 /ORGANISM="Scrippsiella Hangoei, Strain SHTV-5" /LENGTH=223 /DNA_ID=CAMNT_0050790693 /DNA_START=77 /DNA_END=748 /DNA_ORIENTATION=+